MIGIHGQRRTATLNNLLYSDPTTRRKLVVCCANLTTSLLCSVGPVSKALYPCLTMNPFNLFILGTYKRSINRGRSEERAFWETEFQLTFLILILIWPACLHYLLSFGRTTAIITLSCFSILVIHPLAKKLALSVLSNNKNMLYHKRIVAFSDFMYVIAGAIMLLQMWLYLAP